MYFVTFDGYMGMTSDVCFCQENQLQLRTSKLDILSHVCVIMKSKREEEEWLERLGVAGRRVEFPGD